MINQNRLKKLETKLREKLDEGYVIPYREGQKLEEILMFFQSLLRQRQSSISATNFFK